MERSVQPAASFAAQIGALLTHDCTDRLGTVAARPRSSSPPTTTSSSGSSLSHRMYEELPQRGLGDRSRRPRRVSGESRALESGCHRIHRSAPCGGAFRREEIGMTLSLAQRFGTTKPVIAMLHFPALPGRPRHSRELGTAHLSTSSVATSRHCRPPASTACCSATRPTSRTSSRSDRRFRLRWRRSSASCASSVSVPFGVNILWDAKASLALARATGATFIREVLTGVYESDLGMIAPVDRRPRRISHRDRRRRRRALRQHLAGVQQRRRAREGSPTEREARHSSASTRSSSPARPRACHSR